MQVRHLIYTLAACGVALAATGPARAGVLIRIGAPVANATSQGAYYLDVTLSVTGGGPSLGVAGFSFHLTSSDPGLTFLGSVADVPPGDPSLVGVPDYIFGTHSWLALAPTYENTAGPPSASDLTAADLLDPSFAEYVTVAPGQTVGLGRVFFNEAGPLPTNLGVTLDMSPAATGLVDQNATQITGTIDDLGGGLYGVQVLPAAAVPEPPSLALGAIAVVFAVLVGMRRRPSRTRSA